MIEIGLWLAGAGAVVVLLATASWRLAMLSPVPDRLIDEAIDRAGVVRTPGLPRAERRRLTVLGASSWLVANSVEAAAMDPVVLMMRIEIRIDARPWLLED